MAIIKRGILGGFSNKIGNVIGGSWKGIATMRSLPLSVANPRTAGQVEQRGKFAGIVKIASVLLGSMVKPLWDRFAIQQSGYNAFVGANVENMTEAGIIDNFPDFVISRGKLEVETITGMTIDPSRLNITINTTNSTGTGFALATDEKYVLLMATDLGTILFGGVIGQRSNTSAVITLDSSATPGDTFYVYIAYRRVDGSIVSNTSFLEEVL